MGNKIEKKLKVTKKLGMVHYVALSNEKILVRNNKRQGPESYQVEEVELEYNKDRELVSEKILRLVSESDIITNKLNNEKLTDENAALKARIAELEAGNGAVAKASAEGGNDTKPLTVPEMIEKINACATVDEVQALIKDESRKGVLDAANKKITALSV